MKLDIIEIMIKLPFLKKQTKMVPKFLTLDISADGVKCLVFYKENGSLKIIGSGKSYLEAGEVRNGLIVDLDATAAAAQEAINLATNNLEDNIENVIIGVTSDICVENVTTAKITRGSQQPITEPEIEKFNQKIINSAEMQVQKYYADNKGDPDTELQMITSSVVYTKLDGEMFDNLLEQEGKIVEIALYNAFCPVFHIENLQKLGKKLRLNILAISPINFSVLKALKKSELESSDLVLTQIGADFTNVGVIFGGAIIKNRSLHIGHVHFVEELARIMGITKVEAGKVLKSHANNTLSQSESVVVQNCLTDILDNWRDGIELLFTDFSGIKTFASHIYLFGEGVQIPEIEDELSKSPWTKNIPFKSPPNIYVLLVSDLDKIADATGSVVSHEWVGIASLAYIYEELE